MAISSQKINKNFRLPTYTDRIDQQEQTDKIAQIYKKFSVQKFASI